MYSIAGGEVSEIGIKNTLCFRSDLDAAFSFCGHRKSGGFDLFFA
jgi:hypothetical protein